MSDTFDHSEPARGRAARRRVCARRARGAERAAAEQRIARERGFARLVAEWEQRLAPWAAEIAEVAAAAAGLGRIAAALPAQAQSGGLWQSLAFWRGFSFAAGALAAACLAALIYLGLN